MELTRGNGNVHSRTHDDNDDDDDDDVKYRPGELDRKSGDEL